MGLGGVAIAALPSVVRLQLVFSNRLGGEWWGRCEGKDEEWPKVMDNG